MIARSTRASELNNNKRFLTRTENFKQSFFLVSMNGTNQGNLKDESLLDILLCGSDKYKDTVYK